MSKPISPHLTALVRYHMPTTVKCDAELRAMQAVIRAADNVEIRRAVWVIRNDPTDRQAWLDAIAKWQKARAKLAEVGKAKS